MAPETSGRDLVSRLKRVMTEPERVGSFLYWRIVAPIKSALTPVPAPKRKEQPPEPEWPQIYFAVVADCGACTDACRADQRSWQHWLETAFKAYRTIRPEELKLSEQDRELLAEDSARWGGQVVASGLPLAVLSLEGGHAQYQSRIGPKGRNMVRKAEKEGYSFARFAWNDHLDDIYDVNTSMDERGGKPMSSTYRERPGAMSSQRDCDLRGRLCYGAFKDGTLVGYTTLVDCGHFAIVNTILGHGEHLKAGIMNGMIDFMVRDLAAEGRIRCVNYLTLRSGRESLDGFKRRVGFDQVRAIFLAKPRI